MSAPVTREELHAELSGVHRRFDEVMSHLTRINGRVGAVEVAASANAVRLATVETVTKRLQARTHELGNKIMGRMTFKDLSRWVVFGIACIVGTVEVLRFVGILKP